MDELKKRAHWLNWKLEDKGKKQADGTPKMDKVPKKCNPKKGEDPNASSTDPKTWTTYEEAQKHKYKFNGIGCVATGDVLFVDLDNCVKDGNVEDLIILDLIKESSTYTEYSPSGTGLHLLFHLSEKFDPIAKKVGNYECYTSGRYFTVTEKLYGKL